MAKAAIAYLLETKLAVAVNLESSITANAYSSTGTQLITFPSIRVVVSRGTEEPENSGNFLCEVDLTVYGGLDPDNDSNYDDAVSTHNDISGNVYEWLTEGFAYSDLEGIATVDYENELKVDNVRLSGFSREINTSEGVFEETFNLEVYLHQETA